MNKVLETELEKIGRFAAEQVAGYEAVEQVEVVESEDAFERPIYHFAFMINQQRAQQHSSEAA